jgi:hypothetical protein
MPEPGPAQGPTYAERLGVPLRWWAQGVMLLATFWLAFVVAIPGALPWVVTGVLGLLLVLALASYGSARLAVAGGEFRAARAHIPLEHLGAAEALDSQATRRAMGPDADARAFLVMRPYLKRAVRVPVTDPADPTPYWLVGSRHPDALAAALNARPISPAATPLPG